MKRSRAFKTGFSVLIMALIFGAAATTASAIPYSFFNISNNKLTDAAIGEAQLSLEVTDVGGSQVRFIFANAGPAASSIADVYFDDGGAGQSIFLADLSSITNGTGVNFSEGASPRNLPGGNSQPYVFSANFSADSNAPVQPNGVNPGESLGILFDLAMGQTFNSLLMGMLNNELRVGIHVQGFDGGGSESFINNPNPVPEPSTLILLGAGLVGLAYARRNRKK